MGILNKAKQVKAYKTVWTFFQKKPERPLYAQARRPNRKGTGFHLLKKPQKDKEIIELKKHLLAGGVMTAGMMGILLLIVGKNATPEFTILVASMLTLSGLIGYDIISRHFWQKKLTMRINELCANHDRAVRELAKNRSDIGILKEGLGEMAMSVEAQGRSLPPSMSAEAKLIESMVTQLGALGDKPRAGLGTKFDNEILELEMAPPPSKPPPLTELDSEFEPDFNSYSDSVISDLIQHAVHNDKLEVFMQPVVGLPQRRPRMLEIYTRVRASAGAYLPAQRYIDIAQKESLTAALDNLVLLRILKMLGEKQTKVRQVTTAPYIVNIAASTLHDRSFMNDLVAFLSKNHTMAGRLVFELSQRDVEQHGDTILPVIDGLSKLGCRFSMDQVRSRKIDINALKGLQMRFIKLDANWLLSEAHSKTGFSRIVRMKKQLDAAGIDLIVEKIESEDMLRELLDFNIDYGQGYLFGKPDHHAAYRDKAAA